MHRAWSLRGAIGRIGRRRKLIVGGIVEHHQHVAFGIGLDLGIKCGASAIVPLAGGTGPANLVQDARGDNLRTSVLEGARAGRIIVVVEDRSNVEPQEMRRAGAGSGAVGVDRGVERSRGVDGLTRNASVAGIDEAGAGRAIELLREWRKRIVIRRTYQYLRDLRPGTGRAETQDSILQTPPRRSIRPDIRSHRGR